MPNWKKLITSGSDASLNSLTVTNGITGSLFGTASYAISASYLSGYVSPFPFTGSAIITGSLGVTGSVSILGSIYLSSGSIINDSGSNLVLAPPTALPGQSLVIRPTVATWAITSSGFIVYGDPITASIFCLGNTGGLGVGYFGTLNYEITGSGVTQQSLGRPLTGQATFQQGQAVEDIAWTIPSNSSIAEFTLTVTSVAGTYLSAGPGYTGSTTLYYNFEANGLPNGTFITITNNNITSSEHSHVHLVTGDPTTVDLYLGDDDQYVKIEKNAGNVVVGTNLDTYQWIFDTSGSLTAPGKILAPSFTGSLFGTASFAVSSSRAVTSSFAISASQALSSSWAPINAGGSDTQIQFNSGSHLLGTGSFTFNYLNQSLQQGFATEAKGQYSHAEGNGTIAEGDYSHAEGVSTTALGSHSHAEGNGTTAEGEASHAEGESTTALGSYSHAEGVSTTAKGEASHAEGKSTIAEGDYSHAEGSGTTALGGSSHAEGESTTASGSYSHAEGNSTTALGSHSHAEGVSTTAEGEASHAEGESTQAIGNYSHTEGAYTIASGSYQHVQGQYNIPSTAQSAFIIGNGISNASRSNLVFASGSQFQITGSVIATQGFTGSLFGTASFAVSSSRAVTSSFAISSSFATTASFAVSSSRAISSSFATTASFATQALSASFASNGGVTQLLAGPNISLSPSTGLGQVTISSIAGGGGFNTATGSYGSFYDTTTQTNPVANIPRSMSLNTTDISNGVSVSGSTNPFNTYIKTENAGVYNIQFSAQLDKTDSGSDEIVIWLRKNGINLTDTATTVTLSGNNAKNVAAWNWFVNSAANDYYQIIWQSADTNVRLFAEPADGHPGIPSVIVTANRVDQFLSNTGSFSGSFTGQLTGSLFGTSSWANNSTTASFALNGGVTQLLAGPNVTLSPTNGLGQVTVGSEDNLPLISKSTYLIVPALDLTTYTVIGKGVLTSGANIGKTWSSSSYLTEQNRIGYLSTATAGTSNSLRQINGYFSIGQGFKYLTGFGGSTGFNLTQSRAYIGVTFSNNTTGNVEQDTMVNSFGVGRLSTSDNWWVMHNDASGTATKVDTGFLANTVDTLSYYLSMETIGSNVKFIVTQIDASGAVANTFTYTATSDLPDVNFALTQRVFVTNNTNSSIVTLDWFGSKIISN